MDLSNVIAEIERLGFRWSIYSESPTLYHCHAFDDKLYYGSTAGYAFLPQSGKTALEAAMLMLKALRESIGATA